MADTGFTSPPTPASWGDAFAMLPAATAPADAWARVAARLPAPDAATPKRTGRRWRPVLAIAASLALALPVAWWVSSRDDGAAPAHARMASSVGGAAPPSAAMDARAAPGSTSAGSLASAASPVHAATPAGEERVADNLAPRRPAGAVAATGGNAPKPERVAAHRPRERRATHTAGDGVAAVDRPAANVASAEAPPTGTPETLQRLHGESARLEALVAWARDDRMSSGAATVMTAALDDRLRLIDAALSQADIAEPERASLWSQRVDALQELATLEGTRRWMAVHGTSLDAVARVD